MAVNPVTYTREETLKTLQSKRDESYVTETIKGGLDKDNALKTFATRLKSEDSAIGNDLLEGYDKDFLKAFLPEDIRNAIAQTEGIFELYEKATKSKDWQKAAELKEQFLGSAKKHKDLEEMLNIRAAVINNQ